MGSRPYRRKRSSHHSCTPSSVPFTVDGCAVNHAPVFFTCRKRRASWTVEPVRISNRSSSARRTLRFCTSNIPSWRYVEWSAVRISSWPLRTTTRCPVITQDAVQFSGAVFQVWEGQARLFHGQAGDSPTRCSLSEALEEVRNEGVPQYLFHWKKGIPNVGGDLLHE